MDSGRNSGTITPMRRTPVLLLAFALSTSPLAQSFDCKLARTPREQTICADTRLQALDAELAANYKSLRAQLSPESAALVQSDQREWLHWLDLVCPAHGKGIADDQTRCLQNQYFTRVHDLAHITHLGDAVIFPRAHFLYIAAAQPEPDAAPNDPGFGFGTLRWPQIDRPTEAQSAFNAAVKTRAEKLALGFSQNKNAIFDTAVGSSGIIDAYYNIEAANDRLIDITFADGTYGWGAAHPLTSPSSFLWWLYQKRELTVADVFVHSTDWHHAITNLAIASLEAQPDLHGWLGKPNDLFAPVFDTVENSTSWTLTRDGLTITFGQYAVGPYAMGMPEAHIPWTDLQPFLQPTFTPATLPAPIPKTTP